MCTRLQSFKLLKMLRLCEIKKFDFSCLSPSKGTVSSLLSYGMVVHVSDNIKGLVPRTHLSDIILKNPEKKYTEGMKVKCRVSTVFIESPHKQNTNSFRCLNRF